jgi:hypothetical protein
MLNGENCNYVLQSLEWEKHVYFPYSYSI